MTGEYMTVKIYPTIGSVFYVCVPESVEDIDLFLDDHIKNVEFWEVAD